MKSVIIQSAKCRGDFILSGYCEPERYGPVQEGKTVNDNADVHTNWVDESLLQTLGITAVAGRLFSKEFPGDTNNRMILNEAAVKKLGFSSPQEAVGGKVKFDWRGNRIHGASSGL
jgi:putative ABC transport system permease protein